MDRRRRDRFPAVRRSLHRAVHLVGWVTIVVLLDWGLGHALTGSGSGADPPSDRPQGDRPAGQIERDARADVPALANAPWASALYDELGALEYDYVPYELTRVADTDGPLITVQNGVRRSHQSRVDGGGDMIEIWFFGGSTMFGEGQRDRHTIPSEVARLAERDRSALMVRNFGVQGHTAWQELTVFERELAQRPAPDVVVFYDGANEFNAQVEDPGDQPTHLDRERAALQLAGGGLPLPGQLSSAGPSVAERYTETSLIGKAWSRLSGLLGSPAAAGGAVLPADLEGNVRRTYLRTVDLVDALAAPHGVTPLFVWQPVGPFAQEEYSAVAESLPAPIVDLSDVLLGREDVFIDGSHTNERGARIVAEEIYRVLEPLIAAAAES